MKWIMLLVAATLTETVATLVQPRATRVEVDAIVLDPHDRPVRGLRASDFEIREDGEQVEVDRVDEVSVLGLPDDRVGRSVVLLLDDTLVRATLTTVVRDIARLFLSRARPADAVAVVRLTHPDDQAVGPLEAALDRIDEYRARRLPYFGIESIENLLDTVARISKTVGTMPHRRTAVV